MTAPLEPAPIQRHHILQYLDEIAIAAETIDEIRPRFEVYIREEYTGANTSRVFASLYQILAAASAVHHVFNSEPEGRFAGLDASQRARAADFSRRRAAIIRAAIGNPPEALEARAVRNGMEHFSARLDALMSDAPIIWGDRLISFRNEVPKFDVAGVIVTPKFARHFLLDNYELRLLDDVINMNDVVNAVRNVAHRAYAWIKATEGHPWADVLAELDVEQ